jgi:hypothetical protein
MSLTIEQVWKQWNDANPDGASKISAEIKKRIDETNLLMNKITREGLDEHYGLIYEALEYYLLDVLDDSDFERLKKNMNL